MKFGVTFPQTEIGSDPAVIRDYAQAVEAAGFDYLITYDHVVGAHLDRFAGQDLGFPSPPYLYDSQFHEPFTLFAFLAGITKRIELATSILILPQRQTALVAKQAAEVDILSGQRFRLGVGVGWNYTEYEALHEDFQSRGARQEEQITVLRKLWTQELVTFRGRFDTLDRVGIAPRPPRAIPIWIGGGWTDKLLRRVARFADGWMPLLPQGEEAGRIISRLHDHLKEEGRDITTFGLQAGVTIERGNADDWVKQAIHLQSLGATHLTIGRLVRGVPPMTALAESIKARQAIEGGLGGRRS